MESKEKAGPSGLVREMGLLALVATGVCAMVGAAINVMPIMIHRSVPGIGPWVLVAYFVAAVPAMLAALSYAVLASAMPRAGGSYVYASRALNPYLGFVASFSQWFGLSIAVGVVSYILIPFLRDIATALQWSGLSTWLDRDPVRLALSLAFLWAFALVNVSGVKLYKKTLIPLMFLMFLGGGVMIPWGFYYEHGDFAAALLRSEGVSLAPAPAVDFSWGALLGASAILFSTFIGFDSIAQAGGEARNPNRSLPLAIGIALGSVMLYYLLFTAAAYHTIPWQYVAERALDTDLTAPGLMGFVLSPAWTVAIVGGAAIGLINDLPAMILGVSRLMFAWAEDGIFPAWVANVHPLRHTPHVAIYLSAGVSTLSILGCHMARDFFLGVDLLITSMLVNFILISLAVLTLPRRNPRLANEVRFLKARSAQLCFGALSVFTLTVLLVTHTLKDLGTAQPAWYYHSTWLWIVVVSLASLIFAIQWRKLRKGGVDLKKRFDELPPE